MMVARFQKLRVWCPLMNGKWESGKIDSTSGDESFVSLSNGNVSSYVLDIVEIYL